MILKKKEKIDLQGVTIKIAVKTVKTLFTYIINQ